MEVVCRVMQRCLQGASSGEAATRTATQTGPAQRKLRLQATLPPSPAAIASRPPCAHIDMLDVALDCTLCDSSRLHPPQSLGTAHPIDRSRSQRRRPVQSTPTALSRFSRAAHSSCWPHARPHRTLSLSSDLKRTPWPTHTRRSPPRQRRAAPPTPASRPPPLRCRPTSWAATSPSLFLSPARPVAEEQACPQRHPRRTSPARVAGAALPLRDWTRRVSCLAPRKLSFDSTGAADNEISRGMAKSDTNLFCG